MIIGRATMPGQDTGFDMRRFEALSNTIFGVAMTLLAYDIPRRQLTTDMPDWAALWSTYESPLLALLLGFIIAGLFWYSHQRRLVYAPEGTRLAVVGNLMFLLSIVALPLSTGLYGRYPNAPDIIALFAIHLAAISSFNLILWVMAAGPRHDWDALGAPVFASIVFAIGIVVAFLSPSDAKYVWPLAFGSSALASYLERRHA
jgi:TMEM175 potassium channel family protein